MHVNTLQLIFLFNRFVCEEFDELKFALERNVLHIYDPTWYRLSFMVPFTFDLPMP